MARKTKFIRPFNDKFPQGIVKAAGPLPGWKRLWVGPLYMEWSAFRGIGFGFACIIYKGQARGIAWGKP